MVCFWRLLFKAPANVPGANNLFKGPSPWAQSLLSYIAFGWTALTHVVKLSNCLARAFPAHSTRGGGSPASTSHLISWLSFRCHGRVHRCDGESDSYVAQAGVRQGPPELGRVLESLLQSRKR